jgi:hypothetical protein
MEADATLNIWPQMKAELERHYQKLMGGALWT